MYAVRTPHDRLVIKLDPDVRGRLRAEVDGLRAILATATIAVPQVFHVDDHAIIMEYITKRPWDNDGFARLGEALAALHTKPTPNALYGFPTDGWLGKSPQSNNQHTSWPDFYIKERLLPQLRRLAVHASEAVTDVDTVLSNCWQVLTELDATPSLLHGDLWSGNILYGHDKVPRIIDPATYYGHSTTDIAMSQLFGGFRDSFYQAYFERMKCSPASKEATEIYNLYHVLNHANIFGGSYIEQAKRIMQGYN